MWLKNSTFGYFQNIFQRKNHFSYMWIITHSHIHTHTNISSQALVSLARNHLKRFIAYTEFYFFILSFYEFQITKRHLLGEKWVKNLKYLLYVCLCISVCLCLCLSFIANFGKFSLAYFSRLSWESWVVKICITFLN